MGSEVVKVITRDGKEPDEHLRFVYAVFFKSEIYVYASRLSLFKQVKKEAKESGAILRSFGLGSSVVRFIYVRKVDGILHFELFSHGRKSKRGIVINPTLEDFRKCFEPRSKELFFPLYFFYGVAENRVEELSKNYKNYRKGKSGLDRLIEGANDIAGRILSALSEINFEDLLEDKPVIIEAPVRVLKEDFSSEDFPIRHTDDHYANSGC